VDGHPGATRLDGAAGFVATALAPHVATGEPVLFEPKTITEPELSSEALTDYAVVVLCDVERLSRSNWRRLASFVHDGGGLEVFVGDRVSIDDYNRHGYAQGEGLLAGTLQHASQDRTRTFDGFTLGQPVHPMVADFADHPESGLFTARVTRYLPFQPNPKRAAVVLWYTSGAPALVASTFGQGRVLLWTTTANMDWTTLPAKGDFVSIMLEAMAFVAPRQGTRRNLLVGQTLVEPLTPIQSSLPLRVTESDGTGAEPELAAQGDALALRFGPVEQSGGVNVSIGSETAVFAVNVDPVESDLTPTTRSELSATLDRPIAWVDPRQAVVEESSHKRSTELVMPVLALAAVLLFVEMWLALWFGSHRAHTQPEPATARKPNLQRGALR